MDHELRTAQGVSRSASPFGPRRAPSSSPFECAGASQPILHHAFSVLLFTRNSLNRMTGVLGALKDIVADGFSWELIIVDQESWDDTMTAVWTLWAGASAPLRVLRVPRDEPGRAWRAGVEAAKGRYICVLGDDTHLCSTYLQDAAVLMEANADIGALGGLGRAIFQAERPEWLWRGWQTEDIGPQAAADGEVDPARGFVTGAGCVYRAQALRDLFALGFSPICGGSGNTPALGQSSELCHALRLAGWQAHYSSRLRYGLWMPPGKMTWEHCLRQFALRGRTDAVLDLYRPWLDRGVVAVLRRSLPGLLALELARIGVLSEHLYGAASVEKSEALDRAWAAAKRGAIVRRLCTGTLLRDYFHIGLLALRARRHARIRKKAGRP